MNYLLVVITHGKSEAVLSATLTEFLSRVKPLPAAGYLAIDGPGAAVFDPRVGAVRRACASLPPRPWAIHDRERQAGFCTAAREAWATAVDNPAGELEYDYVFWLEHDFEITRTVDLNHLAAVLDACPSLAQMALIRDAVSGDELAAGGLVESRPGEYEPRQTLRYPGPGILQGALGGRWLEHRSYFTTTPSLMRRAFMAKNPWPAHESECEGKFGIELAAAGYTFGAWGEGEPWCRHIGQRTGFGY